MAVDIQITGLTAAQQQEIADAFDTQIGGRPEGMGKRRWASLCLWRFIKAVVREHRRRPLDQQIQDANIQVETDFGDDAT